MSPDRESEFSLLLPYHLISDERIIQQVVANINAEAEYEVARYRGTPQTIAEALNAFYDFYLQSGWFEIEKGSDYILLRGLKPGVSLRSDRDVTLPGVVRIGFRNHVDQNYFFVKVE